MYIKRAALLIVLLALIAVFSVTILCQGHAQNSADGDLSVMAKLDQILSNQKIIMADLATLKEELNIVKIRVTQSQ